MNFAEVKREVANLRQDLAAGSLTEEQFKARLRELMVEDEEGNWWMVGYVTGKWYRHNGTDWVRADPPGHVTPKPTPWLRMLSSVVPLTTRMATIAKSRYFRSVMVVLLGLSLTYAAGLGVNKLTYEMLYNSYDYAGERMRWVSSGIIWLAGIAVTVILVCKVWREEWIPFRAVIVFIVGLTSVPIGSWVGKLMYEMLYNPYYTTGETARWVSPSVVWLGGLILTIVITRKVWTEGRTSLSATVVLFVGLVISLEIGSGVGWLTYKTLVSPYSYKGEIVGLASASIIWLGGLILTTIITRKIWRRK